MKKGILLSFFLHISMFILIIFWLPYTIKNPPLLIPVTIAIETITSETKALKLMLKKVEEIEEKKQEHQKHAIPHSKEEKISLVSEKKPEVKLVKKTNKKLLIYAPKPKQKPKKLKPKKQEKPVNHLKKKSKQKSSFTSVLKNLQQIKISQDGPDKDESTQNNKSLKALNEKEYLTISELDIVSRQFADCWNPPAGAQDSKNLVISVRIWANPDGTIRDAKVISQSSNPSVNAASDSSLRAIWHPRCNPLKLPKNRYNLWKVFIFDFDPKELLGG
jgi:outer membrane biosynthesis protein TonB